MEINMDYFDRLEADTKALYEIANEARSKGLDVETKSEIPFVPSAPPGVRARTR